MIEMFGCVVAVVLHERANGALVVLEAGAAAGNTASRRALLLDEVAAKAAALAPVSEKNRFNQFFFKSFRAQYFKANFDFQNKGCKLFICKIICPYIQEP